MVVSKAQEKNDEGLEGESALGVWAQEVTSRNIKKGVKCLEEGAAWTRLQGSSIGESTELIGRPNATSILQRFPFHPSAPPPPPPLENLVNYMCW